MLVGSAFSFVRGGEVMRIVCLEFKKKTDCPERGSYRLTQSSRRSWICICRAFLYFILCFCVLCLISTVVVFRIIHVLDRPVSISILIQKKVGTVQSISQTSPGDNLEEDNSKLFDAIVEIIKHSGIDKV